MTDAPDPPAAADVNAAEIDAGEPIVELAGLAESPSPRFVWNVLDGVNQRQTTGRFLELVWWGGTTVLLEMIQALFKALGVREDSERKD